jgi:excisionase family DNA binding protein
MEAMLSPYLTASEVADELGISKSGVYKLIQRGRLPVIRRSERGMRVSRLALDAYQRRLQGGDMGIPPINYSNRSREDMLADFEAETGISPAEWERRWKADEIEDSAENMSLAVRAMSLLLYGYRDDAKHHRGDFAPVRRAAAA